MPSKFNILLLCYASLVISAPQKAQGISNTSTATSTHLNKRNIETYNVFGKEAIHDVTKETPVFEDDLYLNISASKKNGDEDVLRNYRRSGKLGSDGGNGTPGNTGGQGGAGASGNNGGQEGAGAPGKEGGKGEKESCKGGGGGRNGGGGGSGGEGNCVGGGGGNNHIGGGNSSIKNSATNFGSKYPAPVITLSMMLYLSQFI
ncbi:hypothetical protein BB559_001707 [Furculomyces boomerangus]|uniref:Uncharacterized protein n=1 Tax=Furculomyces boomerangus TaxID=61424 RepID=A0A2T9Z137_9FUNG|nr:hypothetical protein BB559_001707 [Furculomyces boomerangus]